MENKEIMDLILEYLKSGPRTRKEIENELSDVLALDLGTALGMLQTHPKKIMLDYYLHTESTFRLVKKNE